MNLIQIQEYLKEIPISTLIEYANQSNPDVPSWLALTEIERRNKAQQQVQPPEASVKEKIERKAVEQGINQLAADQARQQQAGQQLAQQMTQPSGQVPEGVPEPVQMASGGIARVPVGDIFKFNGGGIVAFADGGTDTIKNPFEEDRPKEEKRQEKPRTRPVRPRQEVAQQPTYLQESEQRLRGMAVPAMQSPQEALAAAAKTNPALQQPLGAAYEAVLKKLAEQDEANQRAFEERERAASGRSLSQALIEAGEATRGGGGIGSLAAGFGRSRIASGQAADERRARQEALRREQSLNMAKLNSEIENARRAEARGDVEAERKHRENIAKLELDIKAKQAEGFKDLAQTQQTGQYYKDIVDVQREQARRAGASAQSELAKNLAVIKQTFPNLSAEEQYQKALEATIGIRGGATAEAKIDAKVMEDIQKLPNVMIKRMEMSKEKDPAKLQKLQEELQAIIQNEINIRTKGAGGISTLPQGGAQSGTQNWGKAEKVSP
jgi:hypothetical protein